MNNKRFLYAAVVIFIFLSISINAEQPATHIDLHRGSYNVGFRIYHVYDYSRTFKPRIDFFGNKAEGEITRPIQIYLWYPAAKTEKCRHTTYGDYFAFDVSIFDPSADYSPENKANARNKLRSLFGFASMSDSDFERMMNTETGSYFEAPFHHDSFPLIVYGTSINSRPYQNIELIEMLVSNGYIAISSPCVGIDSRAIAADVRSVELGVEAETRDLEYLLSYAKQMKDLKYSKIGAVGFSLGGMSCAMLSLRNHYIDALVSLDGGITITPYHKIILDSPYYDIKNLRAPMMLVMTSEKTRNREYYNNAKYCDAYLLVYDGMQHSDFASLSLEASYHRDQSENKSSIKNKIALYSEICNYTLTLFNVYLKDSKDARSMLDNLVKIDDKERKFRIAFKKALNAPPDEDEFMKIVNDDGVDKAIEIFSSLRKDNPSIQIFSESAVLRYALVISRTDIENSIKLIKLVLEAYPKSFYAHMYLGNIFEEQEMWQEALKYYEKAISIEVDNEYLKQIMEAYGKQVRASIERIKSKLNNK